MSAKPELESIVVCLVAAIDKLVQRQLSLISENVELTRLQGTWAGISWLVSGELEQDRTLIRIMDLDEGELLNNIQLSANTFQTLPYRRIHDEALCTLGGEPFGLLLLDFFFGFLNDFSYQQQQITRFAAELAEESFCPVILGLADDWMQANPSLAFSPARLERLAQAPEYADFQAIRTRPSAHFIGIVWPHILLTQPATDGSGRRRSLACHSGYALLAIVLREFRLHGWFTAILAWGRSVEGGAILPQSDHGQPVPRVRLSETLESSYTDLGIMPLSSAWLDLTAGFLVMPMVGTEPGVTGEARSLPAILILCRFAHYLKVMIRDRIGRMDSARECSVFLQRWLDSYCSHSNISDLAFLVHYPLKRARVKVSEDAHHPGNFIAVVDLHPNLPPGIARADLTVKIQLSTEQ